MWTKAVIDKAQCGASMELINVAMLHGGKTVEEVAHFSVRGAGGTVRG